MSVSDAIKVRAEVGMLSALIQSAFVVQLVGLFEGPLNSVLVTEYLAGGDAFKLHRESALGNCRATGGSHGFALISGCGRSTGGCPTRQRTSSTSAWGWRMARISLRRDESKSGGVGSRAYA